MRKVLPTARKIIDRVERIVLSERDTVRVMELLENPPKPTPALMAAAHRRTTRETAAPIDSRPDECAGQSPIKPGEAITQGR
jgi:hypothetical protein